MPAREIVEYETWDLDNTATPPHSHLYHLRPAGFGTGAVESLTSYFARLAQAHCVSAGALTHHELLPRHAGKRNMFACAVTAKTRCFTSTINNVGNSAARFAKVVGELTGRTDLSRLTMLPWKSVLPPQLLTRGVAAWCPRCFTTWRDNGKIVCMPLLWALEVVKYCPDHRCPLQLVCVNCGKPQPLLGQRCPLGYCSHCKSWLGAEGKPDQSARYSLLPPETPDWEIWVAVQVRDLIRTGFHSPDLLNKQQLADLIRAATDAEGLTSICRVLGVSPSSVIDWRAGRKLPMFPVYLRIACTLNVTLADLLTGKANPSSVRSLDILRIPYWRAIRVRKRSTFDVRKAQQELNVALRESPPPSLTTFQKRTRYHYGTLRGHFPDLCAKLCERFQQHQAAMIENRLQRRIHEFRNIAYQLHKEGIELLVNRVFKRLSPPKSLPYRLACELLLDIKREISSRNSEPRSPFHVGT
jgi:transcriptional regulator with XRE-family HTH domain